MLTVLLHVCAADGQTGPGCVIWEAGVQLARLFVQLAALQQQQQQHSGSTQQHSAGSPTAASCCCRYHQGQAAGVVPTAQPDQLDSVVSTQHLPRLQGARVLELGAGTGIAGITAAACGAHVTLTDLSEAQAVLAANIERNQQLLQGAGGSAAAAVLDWGRLGEEEDCNRKWEWGFGADLVFNAGQVGPVVQAIKRFLQPSAGDSRRCFLLSHKQRHEAVDVQLLQALAAAGCSVRRVDTGDTRTQQVCIWLIRPVL
jgi:SAM-dependent methyltransferase